MEKKPLSKEELIAQLKELSEREIPQDQGLSIVAMCYSTVPMRLKIKCDSCGREIMEMVFLMDPEKIKDVVEQIKDLGYDAKVEFLCPDCAAKAGIKINDCKWKYSDQIYGVFYFKAKGQKEYHVAASKEINNYKAVLAFMKNEPSYTNYFDEICQIKDNLNIINHLTGISVE